MKLSVEVGNVGGPEFFGGRTLFRDPLGNLFENRTAQSPMMQIVGTADGEFSFSVWSIGGPEQVPGIAILGDGRIVGVFDVTFKL